MYVTVNGARLFFDVEGAAIIPDGPAMREKPTVVMVHGGPGVDHSVFKPAFGALSDIAQIVYYDHRGNGRSNLGVCGDWNLAQWGDDLFGLCRELGIEKPIVCGTSFGGFVALSYATRYPDHCGKLALTSTAAKVDFNTVFDAFGRIGGDEAQRIATEYWTTPTAKGREEYKDKCVPLYSTNMDRDPQWLSRVLWRNETALWFNGPNNEHGRMDFRDDLRNITCPVLVMCGDQDPITPIEFSEEIAANLPAGHVQFERFANAGHGIVADAPKQYFDILRAFICDAE